MATEYRCEFADFGGVSYLNAAYQGPLPLSAVRAAQEAMEWKKRPYLIPASAHFDLPDSVRGKIARLIGADANQIALTTGASGGMAAVAAGMDWKSGDEVLIARGEFPSHVSNWLPAERAGKLQMKLFAPKGRFVTADDYIEQIGPRTRLVSASLVRFDDGALLDARRVAKACHAAGAALLLDMAQCAGALPLDVGGLGADFAVGSGYKWMLGPYGTGFFWIADEWLERLHLGSLYYQALQGARDFTSLPLQNPRAVAGARCWDVPETASFTNMATLDASLDFLLKLGVDAIARHNGALVDEIIERLPQELCALASPAESQRRGPYVCITGRRPEETPKIFEKLRDAGIFVSLRENAVRISPHIYNDSSDVSRLIEVLSAEGPSG
jgi:cysteine desulfurase / selenocysteine lyase